MKSETVSRRTFIHSSVAGMAGIICAPKAQTARCGDKAEKVLVYRNLGKTGLRLPVIGMGILSSATPSLMQAALDAGISHFDSTADPAQQMRNEKMIGEVLKGRRRESVIYGTKIHLPQDYKTGIYKSSATEKEFTRLLDAALRNLQMDYVDIVYHHMVSRKESAFHEPVMSAMSKAKKAGKARFLGLTTHSNVPEAVHAAVDSGFYEVVMAAYNPRQKDLAQVKKAIARAAASGLGVVAIKVIRGDADKGRQPVNARASLKWVLQDSNVHATVPGFSNFEEMKVDLSVMEDLSLNEAERSDVNREASGPGMFCQGCGQCLRSCSAELPIPDLMRSYMYAFGYHQTTLAQSLLQSLELPDHVCEDCSSCRVVCTNGWNVAEKIHDILRLRDASLEAEFPIA
ncbi:MAG: aldo/keto reductase [Acidobacteria bacterium]|nr:aldo/keto reductase [Acidobacteriota bacterium]